MTNEQRQQLADKIATYIADHELDFGGRFEDIGLVLEVAEQFNELINEVDKG
jgi:hypothetical protein